MPMNCPVCDRSLAPTLSICPSCGAMMFDSVREELQTKITSGRLVPRPEVAAELTATVMAAKPVTFTSAVPATVHTPMPVAQPRPMLMSGSAASAAVAVAMPREKPVQTADLVSPKTSPTLVGFQSNNPTLPDWRVKLQNAVQQRRGIASADPVVNGPIMPVPVAEDRKPIAVARPAATKPETTKISDPRVAAAMRRIEQSRSTFLEPARKPAIKPAAIPAKPYKFDVVPSSNGPSPATLRPKMSAPQPLQVVAPHTPVKRDTNKLPPISMRSMPVVDTVIDEEEFSEVSIHTTTPSEFAAINRFRIRAEVEEAETEHAAQNENEEIEDVAHFSMRFGAGFFDLIITSFASMLILSPLALTRGGWLSLAGVLTFAGVTSIITFFYMTICLGFYGKTMGMRLFSLELVDAVENEYPSLHQAAVSSSVFIISLFFGGAGFIPMFFNEEKRAAHDLLSGTILVREF